MQIKSKYKIARRLGSFIFDKTQTSKFALRSERKGRKASRPRPKSDFGIQVLEKQRARFLYGVGERQFAKYVHFVLAKSGQNQDELLYDKLERRLDNVIYRLGFAPTRQASRQMVNHGHITVGGKKVTIPSYEVSVGDVLSIKEGSRKKPLFDGLDERLKEAPATPAWIGLDIGKKEAKIQGRPKLVPSEFPVDLSMILEFYKR
ncbi:MAG: 30S ribosomal protein S4 [bacterium]|nr:30S ribosomal protein S4 [bacterium]